jgi:hypothetical protein
MHLAAWGPARGNKLLVLIDVVSCARYNLGAIAMWKSAYNKFRARALRLGKTDP